MAQERPRMRKENMVDETDVWDEQVRSTCFPTHPREQPCTRRHDVRTKTKPNKCRPCDTGRERWRATEPNPRRRAKTIQDEGREIRTDAKPTVGGTRNDDASEPSHTCANESDRRKNVTAPVQETDDVHVPTPRRSRCAWKRRRRRRDRSCRSYDPITCDTKR